jgi:shikimate kinase
MKDLKNNSLVIWLDVKPETVLKRAGNVSSRPLIDPTDPIGSVRKRLAERSAAYAGADHAISTDDLTPEQVVDKILPLIKK